MAETTSAITPENIPTDKDHALRPRNLKDFIGHEELRSNLGVFIKSATLQSKPMAHTLFYGPPGLGKTTLAQIIAREMDVNFSMTSGPVLAKAGDLAAILTKLDSHDVLFIDEIHRLHPIVEEILYPAMEDFALDLVVGSGPAARSVRIDLNQFTLIGATTRLGLLTTPLRDRFGIHMRLEFYSAEELLKIVTRSAQVLNIDIEVSGAMEIARRSRGTPRVANRLLSRVIDFAIVENNGIISDEIATKALDRLGVDHEGLDSNDRKYLTIVADHYDGGPVGIETISAAMSEVKDTVEDVVEPYLMQAGFISRTPRGRMLTSLAWKHLDKKPPNAVKDLFSSNSNET
ncbi:MAG: Holliday junction branch migration DNA helicase RuvB [Rhodobacteraceae bacterium]|nr:Holliday junction branch migration DNA helicase RuvB [Paracoccaceae bacterium]MCY4249971.1 Holliday junction branch migration DNA helicase RuvB [Paracoccaceae bacterium]